MFFIGLHPARPADRFVSCRMPLHHHLPIWSQTRVILNPTFMVFLDQAPLALTLKLRMPYRIVEAVGVAISGVSIDFGVIGLSLDPENCSQKDRCRQLVTPTQHTSHLTKGTLDWPWGPSMRMSRILIVTLPCAVVL